MSELFEKSIRTLELPAVLEKLAAKNTNKMNVPQARAAMDKFKMEAASEEDVYPPQKAPAAPTVSSRSLFACTWRRLAPEASPIKR